MKNIRIETLKSDHCEQLANLYLRTCNEKAWGFEDFKIKFLESELF